ncbi:SAF domain-containing protein [Streptomonospora salina]|uniref:Flp pilus assembly protein CpaB n=1 Tax=Streptomonospora salina TaxID=104205 RepID=A0A841E5M2_9ACTN|nr:SAF domain-containing protein [Streptomonospora salina]MBB5998445.1 Flp pilus assembly protein CpaB [Streptomonospora salina]
MDAVTRRNRRWAVAGAGMVALGALLAVSATAAAEDRARVAVAARDVPAGHAIGEADLRMVEASGLPEGDFPGTEPEDVVGRRAAVALKEGTPIPRTAVAEQGVWPPTDRAVVAAELPASAVPEAADMGAPVDIVLTGREPSEPAADSDGEGGGPTAQEDGVVAGRVQSVERSGRGEEESTVHLDVPAEQAAAVARAAGRDEVRLALTAALVAGANGEDL